MGYALLGIGLLTAGVAAIWSVPFLLRAYGVYILAGLVVVGAVQIITDLL